MTREEKLWSMTAKTLQEVGNKLGLNITNSDIKKGKATIIKKIMEVEANNKCGDGTPLVDVGKEIATQAKIKAEEVKTIKTAPKVIETPKVEEITTAEKKAPKKANLKLTELTYKGETKSIKEWAAQINMPWATLYDRVNRNGWPVDVAIETPLGQRRLKNKEA